jgi:2-polyprenyl-3-methyl-5-hydroxy-6-metoxy-1,4-benzoquinol methylase
MTTLPRAHGAERMDAPDADARLLDTSLADLRAVNRWLGGRGAALSTFRRLLAPLPPARYTLLDIATGSADLPRALVRWSRATPTPLSVRATDLHPHTLEAARLACADFPEIEVERADALALPYAEGAFDFAFCSTALHHFDDEDAVQVLREMARVSRRAVVVSDLARSRQALLGAELLAATVWRRHPITRHDGPLSVRRAYTVDEVRELAARAGLTGARVSARPLFRLLLVYQHTGGG